VDNRLPRDAQRRYRRNTRHGSDRVGILLVAAAFACVLIWAGEQVVLDLEGVATVTASLGFTMSSSQPTRGRPGFAAPLIADLPLTGACDPQRPRFQQGIADLKSRLGLIMGEPRECEHAVNSDGDTVQVTTTGIAAYSQNPQRLTFTDGSQLWVFAGGVLTARTPQFPGDDYSER
jgi:hypothetical protein